MFFFWFHTVFKARERATRQKNKPKKKENAAHTKKKKKKREISLHNHSWQRRHSPIDNDAATGSNCVITTDIIIGSLSSRRIALLGSCRW